MKDAKGFTLIELMIVVAVVGILSMVALPQYQQYVIRGNRAAAEAFMMDVANRQKQFLLDARSYAPDLATLTMSVLPANVSNNYTVTVSAPVVAGAPPTFIVTAAPVAGSKQANDGTLTLDDLGAKLPVGKW